MTDIDQILTDRGSRYGEFEGHAGVTQTLKRTMRSHPNWKRLSDHHREALEMIQHKIGRILNGDPTYRDNVSMRSILIQKTHMRTTTDFLRHGQMHGAENSSESNSCRSGSTRKAQSFDFSHGNARRFANQSTTSCRSSSESPATTSQRGTCAR